MDVILFESINKEIKKILGFKIEKQEFKFNPTEVFNLPKLSAVFKDWTRIKAVHIVIVREEEVVTTTQ